MSHSPHTCCHVTLGELLHLSEFSFLIYKIIVRCFAAFLLVELGSAYYCVNVLRCCGKIENGG